MSEAQEFVVVRIRSSINSSDRMRNTLKKLRLIKPQSCVIVPDTPVIKGMLTKVQHLITWGEVDAQTKEVLQAHKTKKQTKIPSFALHPPRGGYGRKGVKLPFKSGGATGYRGADINKLLSRMVYGNK
jgi:large subunit ribosomal protein L30